MWPISESLWVLPYLAVASSMASNVETVSVVRGEWGNSHRAGGRGKAD